MIPKSVLDMMQCAACGHPDLGLGARRQPELVCEGCGERYPFVDGIPDMVPRSTVQKYRYYRTDTVLNLIAPAYDGLAPLMSLAVWQCPPMRYVDMAYRAIGRAQGGVFLECPINTGMVLGHIQPRWFKGTLLGIDSSWKMLQKARDRFEALGMGDQVTLLRGDPENLPLRPGSVRSLQSTNGLHCFHDRARVLEEFDRVLEAGGYCAGSTLVRGQGALADAILNTYERYGIFPMLRSREYVIQELRNHLGYEKMRHETYGSVLFYSGSKAGGSAGDADA
jgi:ubiquinone/menaquinone biosynthesis C-methylase UbiE/uncharacterized protein YbaR (Trm112 family)